MKFHRHGPPIAGCVPPAAPAYRIGQLPETRGIVQRFTRTPTGEIDGIILWDGTEVYVPLSPGQLTEVAPVPPPGPAPVNSGR